MNKAGGQVSAVGKTNKRYLYVSLQGTERKQAVPYEFNTFSNFVLTEVPNYRKGNKYSHLLKDSDPIQFFVDPEYGARLLTTKALNYIKGKGLGEKKALSEFITTVKKCVQAKFLREIEKEGLFNIKKLTASSIKKVLDRLFEFRVNEILKYNKNRIEELGGKLNSKLYKDVCKDFSHVELVSMKALVKNSVINETVAEILNDLFGKLLSNKYKQLQTKGENDQGGTNGVFQFGDMVPIHMKRSIKKLKIKKIDPYLLDVLREARTFLKKYQKTHPFNKLTPWTLLKLFLDKNQDDIGPFLGELKNPKIIINLIKTLDWGLDNLHSDMSPEFIDKINMSLGGKSLFDKKNKKPISRSFVFSEMLRSDLTPEYRKMLWSTFSELESRLDFLNSVVKFKKVC